MTNTFLGVNKDLFKLELDPLGILIMAQVMEFQRTTGDCFITDETLAENFGSSVSTVNRKINDLTKKGFLIKTVETKKGVGSGGGRIRHLKVDTKAIEAILSKK